MKPAPLTRGAMKPRTAPLARRSTLAPGKKSIGGVFCWKRSPLKKVSKKKAKKNREQGKSKAILMRRHDGECQLKIPGICQWFASDFAHTKGQAQGGGHTTADGKPACRMCHTYATEHPAEAYAKGWAVKSWQKVPTAEGAE